MRGRRWRRPVRLRSNLRSSGVPTVAAYRLSILEEIVARVMRFHAKLQSVILANLIMGENVIPEFLQWDCTPERLADALLPLLSDTPQRRRQLDAFGGTRRHNGGRRRAAECEGRRHRPCRCPARPALTSDPSRPYQCPVHPANAQGPARRERTDKASSVSKVRKTARKPAIRAAITGVFGYVPPDVLSNAELAQMVDTSDEWIVERTGIKETAHPQGQGTRYVAPGR